MTQHGLRINLVNVLTFANIFSFCIARFEPDLSEEVLRTVVIKCGVASQQER